MDVLILNTLFYVLLLSYTVLFFLPSYTTHFNVTPRNNVTFPRYVIHLCSHVGKTLGIFQS